MTFRRQLLLAQAPLALALVAVGVASLVTAARLADTSRRILKDNYGSALAAQRMTAALDGLDRDALLTAIGRLPPGTPSGDRAQFESALALQAHNITEPGEANATERLQGAWQEFLRAADGAAGERDPVAAYLGPVERAADGVRAAAEEIVALNQAAMVRKSEVAEAASSSLLTTMLAALVAAAVVGLAAASALTARTARPVSALTAAVRRFGDGDLSARTRPRGGGELADLGREFDAMADRLALYRRSTLAELLQAQQAAQAAIDSMPDPVLILDERRIVLNLNQAAESLLGLPPGGGAGGPLVVPDPALRARLEAAHAQVLAGQGPVVPRSLEEAVRVDGDEGPRRFLPRATALYSVEREVIGVTVVLQDVTRLVRFDELKNDLVATVAHEVRTPLTGLQMAVLMCAEGAAGPLTPQQAELLGSARHDCARLQALLDELLDLSRIQAGRIALEPRPADARQLVAEATAKVEAQARAAGVALSVEDPGVPVPALADPERTGIVLANLLGNALRHTPPGGRVTVAARATQAGARLEVRDTGPGIPAHRREEIFERFVQLPGRRGSLGLGLYISREIVRAHGGSIGVESEEGRGSTFWFTLPAPPSPGG